MFIGDSSSAALVDLAFQDNQDEAGGPDIYNQGGFGIAHYLAVLTLAAAFGGFVLERLNLFGRFSVYFQAIAYSATILFHMIPAITDFLRRLPVGDPFIDSFDSPVLQGFHLAFLGLYVLGVAVQIFKLRSQAN